MGAGKQTAEPRRNEPMLPEEKKMQVLEVYDLTLSYRDTAALCGVDHHTVARAVANRARGLAVADQAAVPSKLASAFIDKIDEWVARSGGRIRADVVHEKLAAMGYVGSERTTRRVVAALKKSYRHTHHRVYKPWLTEPGGWLQYDFGAGPEVILEPAPWWRALPWCCSAPGWPGAAPA
jgi:hypothetical protein